MKGERKGPKNSTKRSVSAKKSTSRIESEDPLDDVRSVGRIFAVPGILKAVTDAMPGLISYIDNEYRYQFVNRAYTDWFGLKAEEIIGKPLWEVWGPETFENAKPYLGAAFKGKSEVFESEFADRLGGTRFVRASYTPDILDGEVRGIFVLVVDISEEKIALEAINRSEERYRAFIAHSTEGIWRFELDQPIPTNLTTDEQVKLAYKHGYLAECNDAMAKQYGYSSASDLRGARLSDLLVEDDPKNVEFLRAFIESNYSLSEAESHEKDADGNDRYFLNNFVGVVENGRLVRAWGTQRDVTETKLADDATARLAAIVVSSEDAIISKDLMGKITSWNVGAAKMFGYKAEEVVGKPITTLTPPERAAESVEILRKIRREETIEHFETVRRRKDGTDIIVSLTVSPIRNAEGNVVGASKIVRDITERKRIEESIHHNQAMLTLAMQSSRMGVWELDLATNTVSWSEELEEIFGLEKGAFGGTEEHFFELMHEDDREAAWNEVRKAIGEHRDYSIEFRFYRGDGITRWMEGRGEAVYSQKGEPVRLYGVGIDITDRKEAEKALRESEHRFSRFMQHLPGLAWIKDMDGKYVYANESAEKSFGVSGADLYGKSDEEIFPAETAAQFRAHDRRAIESSSGIQIMESLVEDDGILHHSIVSKFPIGGADGKPALIGGIAIDVTDQKQAEEALRQRMDFDEAVMRNMGEGLYTVDAHGLVTSMNPAAEKLFGWSFVELCGRKMHELTHYKHRDGTPFPAEECAGLEVIRGGESLVDHEDVFIRRDGTFFDVLFSSSPLRENDQIVGLVVVFTDITERKLAEQRFLEAERQAAEEYQALLGRIVPLAATLGRARDLVSIYRAVLEFIRTSMECSGFFVSFFDAGTSTRHAAYVWGEGMEVDITELPPMPLMRKGGGANSRAVFEKRTIITNNYWNEMKRRPHVVIRDTGIDPMSSLIVPMMIKDNVLGTLEVQAHENGAFNQEHAVALEMVANLAAVAIENVRLIETEAAAREAAETANRAKDDFLSVLSHELRTPLNAMLGWVRMLKAGVLDEENSERALEVIERNTRLQSSLIEDLLDVSRIISGKMRIETELVDLVSVVETVSETIQPLADAKGVSYRFSCEDEAVFLTADAVRLQQVVSNLLQNSIKFTPAGGSIEISLERTETDAVLNVSDTGVGIDEDLIPHIFDRFRQADASARRSFTGLGLGLTIVRNIIELHNGKVDVRSGGKDKGATFTLTLPLAADFYGNLPVGDQRRKTSKGSLVGKAILLVDDDTENLLPLKIFLENEKADVTSAANALEALEHLADRDFHLMITDIGMPGIDGYELVSRLRADPGARNSTLKTIALTAYASVDDRERALESGFNAHLAKPVNFDELLTTIENIARNGH